MSHILNAERKKGGNWIGLCWYFGESVIKYWLFQMDIMYLARIFTNLRSSLVYKLHPEKIYNLDNHIQRIDSKSGGFNIFYNENIRIIAAKLDKSRRPRMTFYTFISL